MKMKKFIILLLTFILTSCGCSNSNNRFANHTHTFSTEWSYDEEYHWHAATCGHTDVYSSKAKHTFSNWIIDKEPDISEKGLKHRSCTFCPYVERVEIPTIDHQHVPSDPVKENIIEPTCTKSGSYDEVIYCLACEQEISRTTITVPATGHAGFVPGASVRFLSPIPQRRLNCCRLSIFS